MRITGPHFINIISNSGIDIKHFQDFYLTDTHIYSPIILSNIEIEAFIMNFYLASFWQIDSEPRIGIILRTTKKHRFVECCSMRNKKQSNPMEYILRCLPAIVGSKFFQQICQSIPKFNHTLSRNGYLWSWSASSYCLRYLVEEHNRRI